MLWYGSVLLYGVLKSLVLKRKLMTARFYSRRANGYVSGSYAIVGQVHAQTNHIGNEI